MMIGDWELGTERRHLADKSRLEAGVPGSRLPPRDLALTARRCLVVGLGVTGASALHYLRHVGTRVRATDRDPVRATIAGDAWLAPEKALSMLDETDLLVVSPGVPLDSELVVEAARRGIEILGDIELFARAVKRVSGSESRTPEVIAITGTNGKSTVASLVAAMAAAAGKRVAAGANLGAPALDLLSADAEWYVLELSSFQLALTDSLVPSVAVVLNVSADHLDRHPSLEDYAAAKARIYAHAVRTVANRDDPRVMAMIRGRGKVVSFGLDAPAPGQYGLRERDAKIWLCRGEEDLLAADKVPLTGRHNLANVLAAWALGGALGLGDAAMAEAVRAFHPLAHRLTPLGEHGGLSWFDDSKATNVSAACASLDGLLGSLVVIAGGEGKGQDFAPFVDCLARHARAVVLIGAAADEIADSLAGRVPAARAENMSDAVGVAAALAEPGDRVVLSPACSSLDMFENYGVRGDAFARAVEALDGD
ncbi:MAG: UDP-N-acetylmuramoyl-L-alanine--D-glutamate ligase [Gammaproteobacteria bacterium]